MHKTTPVVPICLLTLLPSYCLAQRWTASFSTEWRLGLKEVEPQFFRWPLQLITDQKGYVYVHSYGDAFLRIFDAKGRFVKYLGRKGQGPGEFESISLFFVDANNRLYVNDPINGRITIYADAARTTFHTRPRPPLMIRQVLPLSADSLLLVGLHRTRKDDCILFLTNSAFQLSRVSCLARASLFWSPEDPLYAMQTFRSAIRVAYRRGVIMAAPWLYEGIVFRLEQHHDRWQATRLTGLHPGQSAYTKLPDGTAPWDLSPSEKNNVSFFSGPYGRLALRIHRRSLGVFALANGWWGHFSVDQQHEPPIGFLEIWDARGHYLGYAELSAPPYEILWQEPGTDTFYLLRWQEDLPVIEKARLRLHPK